MRSTFSVSRLLESIVFAAIVGGLCLQVPSAAAAQESPFIDNHLFQLLNGEISGDASFETIRTMTQYHRPTNSPGFRASAVFLRDKALEYGLEDVVMLSQPLDYAAWSATEGEIWITSPVLMKLADLTDVQLMLADNSRPVDVETELVDVGEGTNASDYEGKDVRGKVVFASGNPGTVIQEAVFDRGALGIVTTALRSTSQPIDYPDQIPWQRVPTSAPDGIEADSWFGFVLSARRGIELQALLDGRSLPSEVAFTNAEPSAPVRVKVLIESSFDESDLETEFVEARINGTDPTLPGLVFSGHIQEEKFSANDDNSGCANVLEIARAIKHLIDTGMMPRPKRTLRFWVSTEIRGPYWYFQTHPEARQEILANLHEDMVGAKQTEGSRVQHIIRSPHHNASYLPDVVQDLAEMVIRGNSGYLAALQVGSPYPFSKPIFSHLGTRDGYRAEVVPNFNNSDQMVFNEGIIGVPSVGFINWPDDYIHSSLDDLWQVDPTQLKRNAFIIAATGLYLANAGPAEVPVLVAEVEGRGAERFGKDLRVALSRLADAAPTEIDQAYKTGRFLLEAAVMRERRALQTIHDFSAADARANRSIDEAVARVESVAEAHRSAIDGFYRSLTGSAAPEIRLTAAERDAAGKVPAAIEDIERYLSDRPRPSTGLHGLMTFATWGYVDGETSYLDIYKQVMAEATVHGSWYYGTVTLDQVVQTLEAGVQAGVLVLR